MLAWAIRMAAIWSLVSVAVYVAWQEFAIPPKPKPVAVSSAGAAPLRNSNVYRADDRGHVMIDGAINGRPVRFLVDTGATYVALPLETATDAGLHRSRLDFTGQVQTANGVVPVAPVTLREIRLGQMVLYDVDAMVIDAHLPNPLLGMSVLKRLAGYEMRDGELTLHW